MGAGLRFKPHHDGNMTLILLEALGAALLLVFIVWWTMFSGRRGGEPEPLDEADEPDGDRAQAGGQEATDRSDPRREPPPR